MDEALSKENATERKRCISNRRDGQPCQAPAVTTAGFCFTHAPALATKRNAARQRGGQNSAKIVRLRGLIPPRLRDVYGMLENALEEVHDGKLDYRDASAMASIARAMVSVLTSGELEERVRDLEDKAGGSK
jgi:hypothetical protein